MRPFGGRHYTSFGPDGFWLPDIKKLNVFIGKNNCGKSNVLRFIMQIAKYLKEGPSGFAGQEHRHFDSPEPALIDLNFTPSELGITLQQLNGMYGQATAVSAADFNRTYRISFAAGSQSISAPDPFAMSPALSKAVHVLISTGESEAQYFRGLKDHYEAPVSRALEKEFKKCLFIPQYREFRYDPTERGFKDNAYVDGDNAAGYNLAKRLSFMQSPGITHNPQRDRFYKIVDQVRDLLEVPDLEIEFDRGSERPDHVILRTQGLRRYLESFGTGIHQLIMITFALSLAEKTVVCMEEPESFIHPGLQRRFLRFLKSTSNTYFITTHSNVFLDELNADDTCIYHVSRPEKATVIRKVDTTNDAYSIIHDLQCRASDILQSNGIIWVEGPTDRLYILAWLKQLNLPFVEGIHFSIMFYGGDLLPNLSMDPDCVGETLIPLLRINKNAVVVLDSDKKSQRGHIEPNRKALIKRLQDEITPSGGYVWVTKGREVENYLSERVLGEYAKSKWPNQYKVRFSPHDQLDDQIRHGKTHQSRFGYSSHKKKYCHEICPFITADDLGVLDLRKRLETLITTIRKWNHQ